MIPINKESIPNALSKVFSSLKARWNRRPKKPKKVKPIKKNTLRRKLRALDLKLDRRQRERVTQRVADSTMRVCSNCGEEYTGRFCPQCGQAGYWSRFSWRQAIMNVLDIWGLGSRPIFRTIRDLFWRPGYLVRDYLNGHRQYYFPPFKLLAVTLVLLIFVSYLVKKLLLLVGGDGMDLSGLTPLSIFGQFVSFLEGHQFSGSMAVFGDALIMLFKLLTKNLLYEWLFIAVFLVFCIWIVYRRIGRYNFVETYIFLVFVLCQQWMFLMVEIMGTGLCHLVEIPAMASGGTSPSTFYAVLSSVFGLVAGIVSTVFFIYRAYLFILDFKQFYGLKWKSTISHLFLAVLVGIWFVVVGVLLIAYFSEKITDEYANSGMLLILLLITLIPVAFIFANRVLNKYKAQVPSIVSGILKISMLSVSGVLPLGGFLLEADFSYLTIILMMAGYIVVTVALSILPVILYTKYRRTWLAFVPLLLLIAIIVALLSLVN